MDKGEYHYLRAMFESFGREVLAEFAEQHGHGLDLEGPTEHDLDTIIKGSVKCFILYIKAKSS